MQITLKYVNNVKPTKQVCRLEFYDEQRYILFISACTELLLFSGESEL